MGDDPARIVAACQACNLHIGEPTGDPQPNIKQWW